MTPPVHDKTASPNDFNLAPTPNSSSSSPPPSAQANNDLSINPLPASASDNKGHDAANASDEKHQDVVSVSDDELDSDKLPFSKARCIGLVATVTGAAFLNTLSLQSVVIILPTIGRELDIPDTRLQWIVSSYSLAFGCFLLLWGRVGDIYGKRLIFIAGSAWVTVMTAVNPFIPTEVGFQVVRALHGLGGAANVPTAIGILGVTFPPGKAKNYAFSAYSVGAPLGSVCGNIFSGTIAEYASWKWVFGATAIFAAIITIAGFFVIPPPPAKARFQGGDKNTIDWIGAILVTSGMIALLFALTEGNNVGWSTPWIPALIVIAFLILAVFMFWQVRLERAGTKTPLVKPSVFTVHFGAVMAIMAFFFASFNNYLVYATYYYQGFQGLSPLQTMLRFIPTGVAGCVIVAIVAPLLSRVPTFLLLTCGTFCATVASLLFAVPIPPTTSYFAWGLPAMVLAVVGADTAWPCLTLYTSRALRPQDQAVGGALINAMGQFGRAIGLAISTAIQTAVVADKRGVPVQEVGEIQIGESASLSGIRAAAWMNVGFGLCALALVLLVLRSSDIIGKVQSSAPAIMTKDKSKTGLDETADSKA